MDSTFSELDRLFMQRALDLARLATGRTSPNPVVGCVITVDGEVIGDGYHHRAGTPHAEIHALTAAGEKARGATAYVTLEPCSHFGRTPPCADALIQSGISRVVLAMQDPNPLVVGKGISRLRDFGIQVEVGLLAEEAYRINEAFCKTITTGLPFVIYKAAATLDGKIATETGDSRWVSSEKSRAYAHEMRNQLDVIMVGSETVLRDNPALNCRTPHGRDPVRLVIDGALRMHGSAAVLASSPFSPCIIATTLAAPSEKASLFAAKEGVEVWQYASERTVPLEQVMRDIAARGWNSVLLEGGGKLAGVMMQAGLVDKVEFFLAPKLVGGNGSSPLTGLHIPKMADALELDDLEVSVETGDIHVSGYLHPASYLIKG